MKKLTNSFAFFGGVLGAAAMIGGILLGVYWCIWKLWCFVVPALWADGPTNITKPGFWLFAAAWLLMTMIGNALFKSPGTSSNGK